MTISFTEFKEKIRETLGKEVSFSNVGNFYYADYRPKYPERCAGDMIICLNWTNGDASLMMNLESAIASTLKGTFEEILEKIKEGNKNERM